MRMRVARSRSRSSCVDFEMRWDVEVSRFAP